LIRSLYFREIIAEKYGIGANCSGSYSTMIGGGGAGPYSGVVVGLSGVSARFTVAVVGMMAGRMTRRDARGAARMLAAAEAGTGCPPARSGGGGVARASCLRAFCASER
jgi:hypothetical protein